MDTEQILAALNHTIAHFRAILEPQIRQLQQVELAARIMEFEQALVDPGFVVLRQQQLAAQIREIGNRPEAPVNLIQVPPVVVEVGPPVAPIVGEVPHFVDYGVTWYPNTSTVMNGPFACSFIPSVTFGRHRQGLAIALGLESEFRHVTPAYLSDTATQSTGFKLIALKYSLLHLHGQDENGMAFTQSEISLHPGFPGLKDVNLVLGQGTLTKGAHQSVAESLRSLCTPNSDHYIVAGVESILPGAPSRSRAGTVWHQSDLKFRAVAEMRFGKKASAPHTSELSSPAVAFPIDQIESVDVPTEPLLFSVDKVQPSAPLPLYVGFLGTAALASLYLVAVFGASRTKRPEVRQFFITVQWATGGYLVAACGIVAVIVGFNYLQQKNIYTKPEWFQQLVDAPVHVEQGVPVAQGGVLLGAKALGSSIAIFGLWRTYDYLRTNSTPEFLFLMLAGMVFAQVSRNTLLAWYFTAPPISSHCEEPTN